MVPCTYTFSIYNYFIVDKSDISVDNIEGDVQNVGLKNWEEYYSRNKIRKSRRSIRF